VKGGYHIHPQSIKRQLTETAHSANSALGRFVGIEAYEAAGGVLLRDLFDDHASAHMENPELLERLAIEKLQTAAKLFEADWKWVEVHLSVDYGALRSFGRVYPQDIDPDPDIRQRCTATVPSQIHEGARSGNRRRLTTSLHRDVRRGKSSAGSI